MKAKSVKDDALKNEVTQLSKFIQQARDEIFSAGEGGAGQASGEAAQHLDAVIKATEAASHAIMDAADSIQQVADSLTVEAKDNITREVTKIYEACNFQDLTGQRLNKVMKTLGEVDRRISRITQLFGASATPVAADNPGDNVVDLHDERKLLNGPQLPGQAPSQSDVDALFSSLKP